MMPPRVADIEAYWLHPPPKHSPRCEAWLKRIAQGWRPNKRIRSMGYYTSAEWYGVWIWEEQALIQPALKEGSH